MANKIKFKKLETDWFTDSKSEIGFKRYEDIVKIGVKQIASDKFDTIMLSLDDLKEIVRVLEES